MAQSFLVSNIQKGNFEDLADFIQEISYKKTPFFSKCGRTQAKAILHEWMTQSLKAGAANAQAEGLTPSFAAGNQTPRVRQTNPVQLLALPFSVSGTQDAVNKAGLGQGAEYDAQKDLKMKELALDIDFNLIRTTRVTRDADAGTAGQMDGILPWATGQLSVDATGALLTEDLYNSLAQLITETSGDDADTIFCSGFQKRAVTGWSTPIRRMADEKTKVNAISEYDGDWGVQAVMHDKQMPVTSLLVTNMSYNRVAFLRPVMSEELGRVGDTRKGYVLSELTLEVKNPNAVGTIINLATSA